MEPTVFELTVNVAPLVFEERVVEAPIAEQIAAPEEVEADAFVLPPKVETAEDAPMYMGRALDLNGHSLTEFLASVDALGGGEVLFGSIGASFTTIKYFGPEAVFTFDLA